FFFQAEDGIRGLIVTGVQTCALPIFPAQDQRRLGLLAILNQVMEARKKAEAALILRREEVTATRSLANTAEMLARNPTLLHLKRSEERRVGKGGCERGGGEARKEGGR